ncbi:MAG TPA: plasmid pRiA4b ORF-3 family protein [Gemmataceae bacterium]|nr:plasmid pRiA4b ORF-3 family protein [Gemmataceae bacterium]
MAKAKDAGSVYQLKITLRGIRPPVWRRVQVKDCTLFELQNIIHTCMGWFGGHMHAFEIGGEEYGEPDPNGMLEMRDETEVKLSQVVTSGIKKFIYTYDFGDDWRHVIEVEKTLPAEPGVRYPRCITGKRACPPEDCGGSWGYGNFLKTIQDPKHPEHEEMMEWIGRTFDPEQFDIETVNKKLH